MSFYNNQSQYGQQGMNANSGQNNQGQNSMFGNSMQQQPNTGFGSAQPLNSGQNSSTSLVLCNNSNTAGNTSMQGSGSTGGFGTNQGYTQGNSFGSGFGNSQNTGAFNSTASQGMGGFSSGLSNMSGMNNSTAQGGFGNTAGSGNAFGLGAGQGTSGGFSNPMNNSGLGGQMNSGLGSNGIGGNQSLLGGSSVGGSQLGGGMNSGIGMNTGLGMGMNSGLGNNSMGNNLGNNSTGTGMGMGSTLGNNSMNTGMGMNGMGGMNSSLGNNGMNSGLGMSNTLGLGSTQMSTSFGGSMNADASRSLGGGLGSGFGAGMSGLGSSMFKPSTGFGCNQSSSNMSNTFINPTLKNATGSIDDVQCTVDYLEKAYDRNSALYKFVYTFYNMADSAFPNVQRPHNVSVDVWNQAMSLNPAPGYLYPEIVFGYEGLESRLEKQKDVIEKLKTSRRYLGDRLNELVEGGILRLTNKLTSINEKYNALLVEVLEQAGRALGPEIKSVSSQYSQLEKRANLLSDGLASLAENAIAYRREFNLEKAKQTASILEEQNNILNNMLASVKKKLAE
ncbi:hypothetical protein NEAUS04_0985 [Nematocida ausubeli]|nr:hypothetical protein NEAUS04_0985 [Nematocida ausubeli]